MAAGFEEGIYPAVATPLLSNLDVDVGALAQHCRHLLANGCKGLVLFGTTGEGPSFPAAEKLAVFKSLVENEGFAAQQLLLGNGSASLAETVELLRGGLALGCPGFLVCPPSFYPCSDDGVVAYYRAIVARVADPALKIILYHIPQFSGVPISVHCARTLNAEFPSVVVGIKESEGSLALCKALIDAIPVGFQVWCGCERLIVDVVRYGGAGSICGFANIDPRLLVDVFELGKRADADPAAAAQKLETIYAGLTIEGVSFIPAVKAFLAKQTALDTWAAVRPPLAPLSAALAQQFVDRIAY